MYFDVHLSQATAGEFDRVHILFEMPVSLFMSVDLGTKPPGARSKFWGVVRVGGQGWGWG